MFPFEGETVFTPGISDKWEKQFFKSEKKLLLVAVKLFCKNWLLHNFSNGFHQQKEYY